MLKGGDKVYVYVYLSVCVCVYTYTHACVHMHTLIRTHIIHKYYLWYFYEGNKSG